VDANTLTLKAWTHSLKSRNRSDQTVRSYIESARMLGEFLGGADILKASTLDIEKFIGHVLETRSASTAAVRYRSLQQLYRWAVKDQQIDTSPMAPMETPKVPEKPVPVVSMDELRRLLHACEGREFPELRDMALIRLMLEPGGMRRAEVGGLKVSDIDYETDLVYVVGKGSRPRAIPYGHKTGQAIARYLRARAAHPMAKRTDALWLGQRGALTDDGIAQVIERRCEIAGIPRIHPHQLRHTAAHLWLAESGGDETSAMRLFGWKSRQMLQRYAASTADDRAHAAARRLGVGDKL